MRDVKLPELDSGKISIAKADAAPGWVLLKKVKVNLETRGGILLPDSSSDSQGVLGCGVVMSAGEHCDEKAQLLIRKDWIKRGAVVLYTQLNRWQTIPGCQDEYTMVKSWEIVCKIGTDKELELDQ